jgi:hypothetical protein
VPEPRNFGGRPPQRDPEPGERVHLGIRVTPQLKERLEKTAAAIGRSQSQEAELRLERSFERQDLLPEVLGEAYPRPVAGLLLALGLVMTNAGLREYWARSMVFGFDDRWMDDPTSFDEALQGVVALLNAARPRGTPDTPKVFPGIQFANAMIDAIQRDPPPGDPFATRHLSAIRLLLGPIAKRMVEARAHAETTPCPLCDKPLTKTDYGPIIDRIDSELRKSKLKKLDRVHVLDLSPSKGPAADKDCKWCGKPLTALKRQSPNER